MRGGGTIQHFSEIFFSVQKKHRKSLSEFFFSSFFLLFFLSFFPLIFFPSRFYFLAGNAPKTCPFCVRSKNAIKNACLFDRNMSRKTIIGNRKIKILGYFKIEKPTNFIAFLDVSDQCMIIETLLFLLFFWERDFFLVELKKSTYFIAFFDVSDQYMIIEPMLFLLFFRTKKYFRWTEKTNIFYCVFGCFRSVRDHWNVTIFAFF